VVGEDDSSADRAVAVEGGDDGGALLGGGGGGGGIQHPVFVGCQRARWAFRNRFGQDVTCRFGRAASADDVDQALLEAPPKRGGRAAMGRSPASKRATAAVDGGAGSSGVPAKVEGGVAAAERSTFPTGEAGRWLVRTFDCSRDALHAT